MAGDVLFPDEPASLVATGFIAAGPWDHVGHTELREGTVDKEIARSNDRDDMVATTCSTFLSLTVHCARCHNHKFDPIKQTDYYRLQAVFAGIDRADRPYDADPQMARTRRAIAGAAARTGSAAAGIGEGVRRGDDARGARPWSSGSRICRSSWRPRRSTRRAAARTLGLPHARSPIGPT